MSDAMSRRVEQVKAPIAEVIVGRQSANFQIALAERYLCERAVREIRGRDGRVGFGGIAGQEERVGFEAWTDCD